MTANPPHSQDLHITLPIAPNPNHRKVGDEVTLPQALLPIEAKNWLQSLIVGGKDITGITLYGPGDVLTSWGATKTCLDLLSEDFTIPVSLVCLGFSGAMLVPELLKYKIKSITLLVDTMQVDTAMKLYQWLRPEKKTIPLAQGVAQLLEAQLEAAQTMVAAGIEVVIRTRVSDENEQEVATIAQEMARLGVKKMDIIGSAKVAGELKQYLNVGVVDVEPPMPPLGRPSQDVAADLPKPSEERPYLAVASSDGMDVNLHLGQTEKLLIYGPREDGLACLIETRQISKTDGDRWQDLASLLPDCFALLASHAGQAPREQLATAGIKVVLVEDQIEGLVDVVFAGGKKKGKCKS